MSERLVETVQRLSNDLDGVGRVLRVLLLKYETTERRMEYSKAEQLIQKMEQDLMRCYEECKLRVDDSLPIYLGYLGSDFG